MKLVDILARELMAWPMQYDCLSQMRHDGGIINGRGFDGVILARLELAEDSAPAGVIVTRAQWQAAVDALKADECEHSYGNKQGCPECGEVFAAEWSGEGLPPVGTVCEMRANKLNYWHAAEIKFAQRNVVVWAWAGEPSINGLCTAYTHAVEFRPIRTPETIAAERRELGINQVMADYEYTVGPCTHKLARSQAERIWDSGYRKQEAK
jgi:hypothetical protein